jgi:hypothetical protein
VWFQPVLELDAVSHLLRSLELLTRSPGRYSRHDVLRRKLLGVQEAGESKGRCVELDLSSLLSSNQLPLVSIRSALTISPHPRTALDGNSPLVPV